MTPTFATIALIITTIILRIVVDILAIDILVIVTSMIILGIIASKTTIINILIATVPVINPKP